MIEAFDLVSDLMHGRISRSEAEERGLVTREIPEELIAEPSTAEVIFGDLKDTFLAYADYEWVVASPAKTVATSSIQPPN